MQILLIPIVSLMSSDKHIVAVSRLEAVSTLFETFFFEKEHLILQRNHQRDAFQNDMTLRYQRDRWLASLHSEPSGRRYQELS